MAVVDSSSTDAQVYAAWDDAAGYLEDGSVAKAKQLVTAGTILLRRMPKTTSHAQAAVGLTPDLIQKEIAEAKKFINSRSGESTGIGLPVVADCSERY